MIVKVLEIRDKATFIPALALRMEPENEEQRYLLARSGFGNTATRQGAYVLLMRFNEDSMQYDPYKWPGGGRTMTVAHDWIIKNFDELRDGQVIDVEYILGETLGPKESEREDDPLAY